MIFFHHFPFVHEQQQRIRNGRLDDERRAGFNRSAFVVIGYCDLGAKKSKAEHAGPVERSHLFRPGEGLRSACFSGRDRVAAIKTTSLRRIVEVKQIYVNALAVVCLIVCEAAQPQTPQSQATLPASATIYTIDSAQSEVRLLVFHGGKIGHNHVIVNSHVSGQVNFTGAVATSSFTLAIPVMDFDVDNTNARGDEVSEGSDFAKSFSAGDQADTKAHMLEPKLLDAAHFAEIKLSSTAVTATADGFTATLAVSVAGHASTLIVPFSLTSSAGRISATGSTRLRQTELGLKPLSFMMGAFTVQDEMILKFKFVAAASSGK